MAENEKLLEAARMLQEHCKHTEQGGLCPLAHNGICDGVNNCGIAGVGETIPGEDWEIPEPCRWTKADVNMAKALMAVGFEVVYEKAKRKYAYTGGAIGIQWELPTGLFENLTTVETVQLSDIVKEATND